MSYFGSGVIYIIVPVVNALGNNEMINNMKVSFNSTYADLRKSNDGTLVLFKIKVPVSPVFDGYTWYNSETIATEMDKPAWAGGV